MQYIGQIKDKFLDNNKTSLGIFHGIEKKCLDNLLIIMRIKYFNDNIHFQILNNKLIILTDSYGKVAEICRSVNEILKRKDITIYLIYYGTHTLYIYNGPCDWDWDIVHELDKEYNEYFKSIC